MLLECNFCYLLRVGDPSHSPRIILTKAQSLLTAESWCDWLAANFREEKNSLNWCSFLQPNWLVRAERFLMTLAKKWCESLRGWESCLCRGVVHLRPVATGKAPGKKNKCDMQKISRRNRETAVQHWSQSLYELFLMPTWQEKYDNFRTGTWFWTSFGKKLFSYTNRKFIVIPKFNMLVNSPIVSAFKMIHRRSNILLLLLLLPMIVVTVVGDSHSRLKSPCIWRASHKVAALMNIVAGVITHRQMNVLWHFYVHLFDSHKNRIELLRKKRVFSQWLKMEKEKK